LITEIYVSGLEPRLKKIDDFDWAEDVITSYAVAMEAHRGRYLEELAR
tara:strand:- start:140 stop:283 length:144 start_codon:yes stop_codon:yes gene_type:complete